MAKLAELPVSLLNPRCSCGAFHRLVYADFATLSSNRGLSQTGIDARSDLRFVNSKSDISNLCGLSIYNYLYDMRDSALCHT